MDALFPLGGSSITFTGSAVTARDKPMVFVHLILQKTFIPLIISNSLEIISTVSVDISNGVQDWRFSESGLEPTQKIV